MELSNLWSERARDREMKKCTWTSPTSIGFHLAGIKLQLVSIAGETGGGGVEESIMGWGCCGGHVEKGRPVRLQHDEFSSTALSSVNAGKTLRRGPVKEIARLALLLLHSFQANFPFLQ